MQKNRNIDISRVKKEGVIKSAPKIDEPIDSIYKVDTEQKNKTKKRDLGSDVGKTKTFNYFMALSVAVKSIFSSDIFGVSLLRNLFSLRVIFFVSIPFIYVQLKYLLVLKTDEILDKLRSTLSPDNTFQFMMWGLLILVAIILSWLADSLFLSAMYRYKYQSLDSRRATIARSLKDILGNFLSVVSAKFVRLLLVIIGFVAFGISIYMVYLLGYGSLQTQITWLIVLGLLVILLFVIFASNKYWLNVVTSVELYDSKNKYKRVFSNTFLKPLSSFGYGFGWLAGLIFAILFSMGMVGAEIYTLQSNISSTYLILLLATLTTSIFLVWTAWTASEVGYWTSIVHSKSDVASIKFGNANEGSFLGFGIVMVIILLIIGGYLVLAFLFSTQVSEVLLSLWRKLPSSVRVNLSKPQ